jgi:hypothetical protein
MGERDLLGKYLCKNLTNSWPSHGQLGKMIQHRCLKAAEVSNWNPYAMFDNISSAALFDYHSQTLPNSQ